MANKKQFYNPLNTLDKNSVQATNVASHVPNMLADLTTGMDVFIVDIKKLIEAPKAWNFYSQLSDAKMFELINSILNQGLLNPIIVWEQDEDKYMILSGHNRIKAYEHIYNNYAKDNDIKAKEYNKIHAHIIKKNIIDEEDAKQIIIDTNWVQRILSPIEKQKSIFYKYTSIGRKQKSKNGESDGERIRDKIGKEFDISGRQISKYIKLNKLTDEFKSMMEKRKININAGVILANFDDEMQHWIYTNFKEDLNNKTIYKLKEDMNKEAIELILTDQQVTKKNNYFESKSVTIPTSLKTKYINYMFRFYKENTLIPEYMDEDEFSYMVIKK